MNLHVERAQKLGTVRYCYGQRVKDFNSTLKTRPSKMPLMVLRLLGVLVVLVTLSINALHADSTWVVREDGAGPVKIGMSLPQLNAAIHEKFSMPRNKDDQACFYVKPAGHPHIAFMIEDGRLARVDVDGPGIFTSEGIQVGDSEARAKKAYGSRLKIEPDKFSAGEDHYLTVRSVDGHYGVRFESESGKINGYYAGRFEAIQYVEGCE